MSQAKGVVTVNEMERLTRCRRCEHPWKLHRTPGSEDLCLGITSTRDGICRCGRIYPPEDLAGIHALKINE